LNFSHIKAQNIARLLAQKNTSVAKCVIIVSLLLLFLYD